MKHRVRAVALVTAALIGVGASSAFAMDDPGDQPRVICGPSAQVRISTTISDSTKSTGHEWMESMGWSGQSWTNGTAHSSYTGKRVVDLWGVITPARFLSYGAYCS